MNLHEIEARKNPVAMGTGSLIQRSTMTERLVYRKAELEHELAQVNEALGLLEQNPQTQQVLDTLAKLNFGF